MNTIEPTPNRPVWRVLAWGALLCLLICAVYIPALWGGLYLDDKRFIFDNNNIHSLSSIPYLCIHFFYIRGWTQISFAFDWYLYNGSALGMHITSIILHLLATLLVWLTASRLLNGFGDSSKENRTIFPSGYLAAVFFGLHPIATQPVTHLISRANILAVLFYLVGFWFTLKLMQKGFQEDGAHERERSRLLFISCAAGVITVLGLGAKEIIVTLPAMVLITAAIYWREETVSILFRRLAILTIPFLLFAVLFCATRVIVLGGVLGFEDAAMRPWTVNLMTQACVIVLYYIPKIFFPLRLYYDPYYPEIHSLNLSVLFSAGLILALLVFAVLMYKRAPVVSLGILWFFVTLSVTSSFIPLADVVAERRVYLSLIGLSFIFEFIVLWFFQFRKFHVFTYLFCVCLVISFSYRTYLRNTDFKDIYQIYETDLKQQLTYGKARPRTIHGIVKESLLTDQLEKGNAILTKYNIDLFYMMNQDLKLDDKHDFLLFAYTFDWNDKRLISIAEDLVNENPKKAGYLITLQNLYLIHGRYNDAETIVDRTLKLYPLDLDSLLNKANLYKVKGDTKNVLKYIQIARKYYPNHVKPITHLIYYNQAFGLETKELEEELERLKKLPQNQFETLRVLE